jgi:hypothetical protein
MRWTRNFAIAALLFVPVAARAQAPFDASKLTASRDSFTVLIQGAPQGWQVTTVERTAEGFVVRDLAQLGPTTSTTEIRMSDVLAMQSMKIAGEVGGQAIGIQLAYADGRAKGSAQLPTPQGIEPRDLDVEVPVGVVDDNALKSLLASLPLAAGATWQIPVMSPALGQVLTTTLTVGAAEQVTVPAGTFDVFPAQLGGAGQPVTFYMTSAAPHRLVKISIAGVVDVVLEK